MNKLLHGMVNGQVRCFFITPGSKRHINPVRTGKLKNNEKYLWGVNKWSAIIASALASHVMGNENECELNRVTQSSGM